VRKNESRGNRSNRDVATLELPRRGRSSERPEAVDFSACHVIVSDAVHDVGAPAIAGRGTPSSPSRAGGLLARLAPIAALAILGGTMLGRFAFLGEQDRTADTTVGVTSLATDEEVLADLERRAAVDPTDVDAWQQLGSRYVDAGLRLSDVAYFELANQALEHAEALAPGAFATVLPRGTLDLTLHRFADALDGGTAAIALNPFSAEAHGVVVDALVELGRYDEAAETLQRMLDLDPGLPALSRASYVRELHGDLDGAVQAMQQAEAAGSPAGQQTAVVVALVGDLHLERGDLDQAAAAYGRASSAYPSFPPAELGDARVRAARGDIDGAVADLDAILDRAPSPGSALLLGHLLRLQGRTVEAADVDAVYRTLMDQEAAVGHVVDLELAQFEADSGDPRRAVSLAEAAAAARPGNVFVEDALGWALLQVGRPIDAIPHVEAALRLGTARASFHVHAAAVYAATGDREAAVQHVARAFERSPWSSLGLLDEARTLAAQLGVEVPERWRPR